MKDMIDKLKSGKIMVCDGGMGTSLQAMGLELGQAPEEWNISNPIAVKNIHKNFIEAGCNMITTNTFGANRIKLKKVGLEENTNDYNAAGVMLARQAAGDSVYVLGDIGPTGEFLKPVGNYSREEFNEVFFEQAKVLVSSGIDAFIIETMSSLDELEIVINACRKAAPIPIIATMTFAKGKKDYRTMAGVSIKDAVENMVLFGCDVIGANCGCGTEQMIQIISQMRGVLKEIKREGVFLIAQPNAGMPKLIGGKTIFMETPQDFAAAVPKLIEAGANIIGGCCGTTPEHIRGIAKIVKITNAK